MPPPQKIPIALQAHSISCHSTVGHFSTLWQLLRDGDRTAMLPYCRWWKGMGAVPLFLPGVCCLTFRKAPQNIFIIDVTQVRLSKPGIWGVCVCMPIMPVRLPLHIKGTLFQIA